jgi:hypothetical protein
LRCARADRIAADFRRILKAALAGIESFGITHRRAAFEFAIRQFRRDRLHQCAPPRDNAGENSLPDFPLHRARVLMLFDIQPYGDCRFIASLIHYTAFGGLRQ